MRAHRHLHQFYNWTLVACVVAVCPLVRANVQAVVLSQPFATDQLSDAAAARACRLVVADELRSRVQIAWERSTTFRHQCGRIARTGAIVLLRTATSVQIQRPAPSRIGVSAGAVTVGQVPVQVSANSVERIGHEVGHVLEFLETMNLREKLAHLRSGVTVSGVGYETDRAVDAGRRAAREVRDNQGMQGRRPEFGVLRVHLYVEGGVDPSIVGGARLVAEELLAAGGVATAWWSGDQARGAEGPSSRPDVVAILRADPLRRNNGRSCGFAAPAEHHTGGSLLVSVQCVADFAIGLSRSDHGHHPWLAMPRYDDLVGAVIAHEIAHLLGLRHATSGVMRSGLHPDDLLLLRAGKLAFQQKEVRRLRMGLAAAHATRTDLNTQ